MATHQSTEERFATPHGVESGPEADADAVRASFWPYLRKFAAQLPFTDDLLAAYYCAFDDATPRHVRMTLLSALAYFVLPIDAVPDVIAGLGFTDDAAVLAAALRVVSQHILPEHRTAASDTLENWRKSA
ncbi:MAG: YkvA family protein [Pseudomonadota bacterium]